jgi:zinc and cadmium transporter
MPSFALPIFLAIVAAGANVAGGAIVTAHGWANSSLRYFIALGSGFMLGAVFLEMIPESINAIDNAPAWVLGGYLIVHMFEHTFAPHLHFGEETHHDEVTARVGVSALIGLLVHTFFDGVAIGAAFQVSSSTGVLIFLAVLLHKIPDGFTVSSIALSSGFSRKTAFNCAVLLGLATVGGVIAVLLTGGNSPSYALPISAGATLYVAASDLMPEVNREPGVKLAFVVFLGVAMFLGAAAIVR